jgi:hypothetical protein
VKTEQATLLREALFETDHLDLALTKVAEGREVLYRGPHRGLFRFESVKVTALRRYRASARVASVLGLGRAEEARLRKFFAGA